MEHPFFVRFLYAVGIQSASEESYLFDPEIHQLKPGCSRPQDFKDKIFYSYDIVGSRNAAIEIQYHPGKCLIFITLRKAQVILIIQVINFKPP
jgi:hypothetical protein